MFIIVNYKRNNYLKPFDKRFCEMSNQYPMTENKYTKPRVIIVII